MKMHADECSGPPAPVLCTRPYSIVHKKPLRPTPIGPGAPEEGRQYRRVLCARNGSQAERGLRASGRGKAKAASSEDESVQRGQRQYKGRCPCVRMYGAPATSAGTPRRLRAQEPRPATSIKAGAPASPAWGLRRTAVGRAPRATSTPPRAAPPRLASYNGTVGATVGRASRARLSPPRQPTPLLSGTCLTSAGRPPLRRILATEGPAHYVVLSKILHLNFREFLFHALG